MATKDEIQVAFDNAVEVASNYDGTLAEFGRRVVAIEDYAKVAGLDQREAELKVMEELRNKLRRMQKRLEE